MHAVDEFRELFAEVFPEAGPAVCCRAPGRVNLIGEHTDYNGLPVLPMAIAQDIRIAFALRDDSCVRMHNTDPAFPPVEFENGPAIAPSPRGAWENYCKAAFEGLNQHFRVSDYPGLDMLVSGSIPMRAGLSSSSALVVACALAYLRALGKTLERDISRLALAALMADAERYVGTRGGGMDQAIILLGRKGHACKIDFFPLRIEYVPLPSDYSVVVCNSLVQAAKTGAALQRYNAGPRLCGLICKLVEWQAQKEFGPEVEIRRLGDLYNGHLCLTHAEVEDLFRKTFPRPGTRTVEAARALNIPPDEIRARWTNGIEEPPEGFPLQARARHQRTECRRVEAARDALLAADPATLGALMDASHESCAKDYEISCRELETLVRVARDAGALGARLTGAGFGGCTVNLTPARDVEVFHARVQNRYYDVLFGEHDAGRGTALVFTAQASEGANYL